MYVTIIICTSRTWSRLTLSVRVVRVGCKFQKSYTILIASTYVMIMQQAIKLSCIYFYTNVSQLLTQLPDLTFAVVSCTVTDVYNIMQNWSESIKT